MQGEGQSKSTNHRGVVPPNRNGRGCRPFRISEDGVIELLHAEPSYLPDGRCPACGGRYLLEFFPACAVYSVARIHYRTNNRDCRFLATVWPDGVVETLVLPDDVGTAEALKFRARVLEVRE